MSIKPDRIAKVLLIGDSSVGKSCIFLRLTEGSYTSTHISTIGIDFKTRNYNYKDELVGLQIWDTAGQERYLSITKNYFKHSRAIVLVYDISNRKSFLNLTSWIKSIKENVKEDDIVLYMLGNKSDLSNDLREVSYGEAEIFADENGVKFAECSAKNNININEIFTELNQFVFDKMENKQTERLDTIELSSKMKEKIKCYCNYT